MSFRENLQYLRASKNLTQEQLAVLLGVSRQSVTKWEAERSYPEMDKLLKLCQLFDCTLDDLVQGNVAQAKQQAASMQAAADPRMASPQNPPDAAISEGAQTTARPNEQSPSPNQNAVDNATSHGHARATAGSVAPRTEDHNTTDGAPCSNVHGNARVPAFHAATSAVAKPEDVTGYDAHWREFARKIATGVGLCAVSVAAPVLAGAECGTADLSLGVPVANLAVFVMFSLIALGVAQIVPAAIAHKQFRKEHPFVIDFYTIDERRRAARVLGQSIATGIACVLAGGGFCVLASNAVPESVGAAVVLACVAVGAALIVHAALMRARANVESYNAKSVGALSEREIARLNCDNEQERERIRTASQHARTTHALCGAIMIAATIIGLVWMFAVAGTKQPWGYNISSMFWLSWVVGGLTCGIVSTVRNASR